MPIEINYEDITPGAPQSSRGISAEPGMNDSAPGGTVINWLEQLKSLLGIVNEIIMNYKDIGNNIRPEQTQRPAQSAPFPTYQYIEPPTGRPPTPLPPLDINAALVDKAKQIILTLHKLGFADATVEDIYNSFKAYTVKQIGAALGVTDDTGLNK